MNDPRKPESRSSVAELRRSLALLLARAVQELRPGSARGGGAVTQDGFYYDFKLSEPLHPDDFPALEARIRKHLQLGAVFARRELLGRDIEQLVALAARQLGYILHREHE